MKYSFFCPHSLLIILLCASFLIAAKNDNIKHFGGKAVKADLVAIFSQLEKVAQSSSFQKDLAELIKKHTAKLNLKKEQFKDLKELLTLFDQFAKIDLQQLNLESQQSGQEFSQTLAEQSRLWEAKEAGNISEQEYIENLERLPWPKRSVEKERWPLSAEWEDLLRQLDTKLRDRDFIDALEEVFGDQYDIGLIDKLFAIGSNAAQAAIDAIDSRIDFQEKSKKIKEIG